MKTEDLVREFVRAHKVAAKDSRRARKQLDDKRVTNVTSLDNKRRQQG